MNRSQPPTAAGERRPRGRPRKGTSQLTPTSIARAALAEIDAVGLEETSVRSVARRLGVDPKSLYNHVEGKEGLLDAVADHILSTIEIPEMSGDPAADIAALARAFRTHALMHPHATSLVLTRQSRSVTSLRPVEAALSILERAGSPPERAVQLLRLFMATMIGVVLRQAEASLTWSTPGHGEVESRIEVLRSSGLPHVTAASAFIATIDHDAEFEFTLAMVTRTILGELAGDGSLR